jgi:actin-related protein
MNNAEALPAVVLDIGNSHTFVLVIIITMSRHSKNMCVISYTGSNTIKAGFHNHLEPAKVIPTRASEYILPVGGVAWADGSPPGVRFGKSATASPADSYNLTFPVNKGVITDHDTMEKLLHYTFNELNCAPEEHHVLVSESSENTPANRARTGEQMFEVFQVPSLCFSQQPMLALYSAGIDAGTGVVLDGGHSGFRVTSICDGNIIPRTDGCVECVSGHDIDNLVAKSLQEAGITLIPPITGSISPSCRENVIRRNAVRLTDLARSIKEKLCFTSSASRLDAGSEPREDEYLLPDGEKIGINSEILRACTESLFTSPAGGYSEGMGSVLSATNASITNASNRMDATHLVNVERDLWSRIVVTGGVTCMKGFIERLTSELQSEMPGARVIAPDNRQHSVWVGGAILATHLLSSFGDDVSGSPPQQGRAFITKEMYEEHGHSLYR